MCVACVLVSSACSKAHEKAGACRFFIGSTKALLCVSSGEAKECIDLHEKQVDGKRCLANLPLEVPLNIGGKTMRAGINLARDLDSIVNVWPLSPHLIQVRVLSRDKEIKGAWKMSNGRSKTLLPLRVHGKERLPYAQPDYEVGFAAEEKNNVIFEHRLTLALGQKLEEGRVYRLQGPRSMTLHWPFSSHSTPTPIIQLNQRGYQSGKQVSRFAYLSWWFGKAGGLRALPKKVWVHLDSGEKFSVETKIRKKRDLDSGGPIAEIDLGAKIDGKRFYLRAPGVGRSPWTHAKGSESVYSELLFALMHQRFGFAIPSSISKWHRAKDHRAPVFDSRQHDAFSMLSESTPQDTSRRLSGGHFDAGDFDIRPTHTVVAQLLMSAFELNPEAFADGELRLPRQESNNGIPDLLDEAHYSLKAWVTLQERDGSVRGGIESHRHPIGIYPPERDELPYWSFAPDPQVTARVSALFAMFARLVKPFSDELAHDFRARAMRAYRSPSFRQAKPAWQLFALSELLAMTGDKTYANECKRLWNSFGDDGIFNWFALEQLSLGDYEKEARVMPDFVVGYLRSPHVDPAHLDAARRWLGNYAESLGDRIRSRRFGHRNLRRIEDRFGWGDAVVMGRYLDPLIARFKIARIPLHERQRDFETMSLAADYMLGANPLSKVWMTGEGVRDVKRPLHLLSLASLAQRKTALPGLVVFGPASDIPGYEWMQPARNAFVPSYEARPRYRRYGDVRTLAHVNEFSVWETQAPTIYHFAALKALSQTISKQSPEPKPLQE